MAPDGIAVAALTAEFNKKLTGGRLVKIAQPEKDALLLTVKSQTGRHHVLLSANASMPLAYIIEEKAPSPESAPVFLMLARKHLSGGIINSITQPGLERIIRFEISHLDEMGDINTKSLIIELMGKHSNIIITDGEDNILDAIKRVSFNISSMRQVLPGLKYYIPENIKKADSLHIGAAEFSNIIFSSPKKLSAALSSQLEGISNIMAMEICHRASADPNMAADSADPALCQNIYATFSRMMEDVKNGIFHPNIISDEGRFEDFSAIFMSLYPDADVVEYDSISRLLDDFYTKRDKRERISQKSSQLRHTISTISDRLGRKYVLQEKQLADTEKMDRYRKWGGLLQIYGHEAKDGATSIIAPDYEDGDKPVTIPLDPSMSIQANANRYFERYSKLKRTRQAVMEQLEDTKNEIAYVGTIMESLNMAQDEADLEQIRNELAASDYVKKRTQEGRRKKERPKRGRPLHFVTPDGHHLYVGKNNYQNDFVTYGIAEAYDWWFHVKKAPGSHVVLKVQFQGEDPPAETFTLAGQLAAYYSSARETSKTDVDYCLRREVRKPNGSKPGFVVYYTNYSMTVSPCVEGLKEVTD